jgi:hypothetical protein
VLLDRHAGQCCCLTLCAECRVALYSLQNISQAGKSIEIKACCNLLLHQMCAGTQP